MTGNHEINWVAVDWGTSNVRAFALDAENQIVDQRDAASGMGVLQSRDYPAVLAQLCAPWIGPARAPLPVLICGMAGSKQGWQEAPYAELPARFDQFALKAASVSNPPEGTIVSILPGICQRQPSANVMRGEETQLAGLLAKNPDFTGLVCLPGTHCKWVHVAQRAVTGFQTFMTGELFDLLSTQSILRHSVTADADEAADAQAAGFAVGCDRGLSQPANLTADLFAVRAGGLLENRGQSWSRGFLSGLLIGSEVKLAIGDQAPEMIVQIIAAPGIGQLYEQALAAAGVAFHRHNGADLVLDGLAYFHSQLESSNT